MVTYLLKRLGLTTLVVILVMTLMASLVHIVPGDPVRAVLGPRTSPELVATVRKEMNLDASVQRQVVDFIAGAVRGDLGRDFLTNVPVSRLIGSALPHTVILAVFSLSLACLVGIPLGVYAATHPNSALDRITRLMSISLITLPSFVAGLFLLLVFAVHLELLPAIGAGTLADPLDYLRHLVLPAFALAMGWIGYLARLVRASMLEILGTNYIRAAQALGVRNRVVFYRYALKNALIPIVALLGLGLGLLVGGAVFVELIFARPGIGTLLLEAIQTRNFTIVRGVVLVVSLLFIFANLVADLSYRLLDPRIRLEDASMEAGV